MTCDMKEAGMPLIIKKKGEPSMKKLVALLLCLMLLTGTSALAAEHLANYYNPPAMQEGQYPIPQQGVKLTYWMPINAGAAQFISSYDENPSYQKAQADTGVDIEFIHPASGRASAKARPGKASAAISSQSRSAVHFRFMFSPPSYVFKERARPPHAAYR